LAAQGSIRLPDGPGMGYVVDEEKIAQYRLRWEELRA
jgi:L-alanine-DL-glutamate epimerase-like enolase superfamily enzyme